MATSESLPAPSSNSFQADSLDCDIVEPTGGVVDTTVRPMRESLRKRLKPPYSGQPPTSQPPQEPPQDKPAS
jgi:hypothetical protein